MYATKDAHNGCKLLRVVRRCNHFIIHSLTTGLAIETKYKCVESGEEMESVETERSLQLSCFVDQDVKYLHTGLEKVGEHVGACAADREIFTGKKFLTVA